MFANKQNTERESILTLSRKREVAKVRLYYRVDSV